MAKEVHPPDMDTMTVEEHTVDQVLHIDKKEMTVLLSRIRVRCKIVVVVL